MVLSCWRADKQVSSESDAGLRCDAAISRQGITARCLESIIVEIEGLILMIVLSYYFL
jgi:hypothetical protein